MLESREAAGNVARRRDATLVRATGFAVPRGIVVRWTKLIFGFCTDLKPIEPMSLVSFQRSLGDVKKNTPLRPPPAIFSGSDRKSVPSVREIAGSMW